jgi:RNA polymerase sigma-70 factor (ECF subfamily)
VAALILHGLTREEIACALQLARTAFRRRLTELRRALDRIDPSIRARSLALAYARCSAGTEGLELGLLRRALLAHLRAIPGIGTHDPDGHLLVIRDRKMTSQSGHPRQR